MYNNIITKLTTLDHTYFYLSSTPTLFYKVRTYLNMVEVHTMPNKKNLSTLKLASLARGKIVSLDCTCVQSNPCTNCYPYTPYQTTQCHPFPK